MGIDDETNAAPSNHPDSRDAPPVRARELLAAGLLIVLADLTIYRGQGFAGYAALFAAGPALLLLGAAVRRKQAASAVIGAMLLALALRLAWCGSALAVACGAVLLVVFAMTLAGLRPYVLDVATFAGATIPAGYQGLVQYERVLDQRRAGRMGTAWLSVLAPLAAVLVFGTIFILANPDVVTLVSGRLEQLVRSFRDWIAAFAPSWWEVVFWIASGWISIGLLRPTVRAVAAQLVNSAEPAAAPAAVESPLYAAARNTLLAVIVLFAAYLVFEFKTLWFHVFPKGFYYSGYAHEGAAWLTLALALATGVLSFIFRGATARDPRRPQLERLAWIWSAENVLLALAVYHRMWIYVGFNGMTRMRTVGLFGISAVVVGFVLVIWKIARKRDFLWLVRRNLWTLALAINLYAITPVDMFVHTYNVRRIMAGDPAPAVQITEHPVNSEGMLVLGPLVDAPDPIIREGVRAMLAERRDEAAAAVRAEERLGWTSFQLADRLLLERLEANRAAWQAYADPAKRQESWRRFREYAYQWY